MRGVLATGTAAEDVTVTPAVAQMMESIMQVASARGTTHSRLVVGPRDGALRAARTCYDHLAGGLGVALANALIEGGRVELTSDGGMVTKAGVVFFDRIGVDLDVLATRSGRRSARVLCRPCLDWSERGPHLAGTIGAALCAHCFGKGWIRRDSGTRAVTITPKGRLVFRDEFDVRLE